MRSIPLKILPLHIGSVVCVRLQLLEQPWDAAKSSMVIYVVIRETRNIGVLTKTKTSSPSSSFLLIRNEIGVAH
jgi:hypothetical protein